MTCSKHNWTALFKDCPICDIETSNCRNPEFAKICNSAGKATQIDSEKCCENGDFLDGHICMKQPVTVETVLGSLKEDSNNIKAYYEKQSGKKNDQGKPDMSLLSSPALLEMAKVLSFGKIKYSAHNWRGGFEWSRLYGAAQRHLNQWNDPYQASTDSETKLSHLAHAAVNIMMLIEHEIANLGVDDRHKGKQDENNS